VATCTQSSAAVPADPPDDEHAAATSVTVAIRIEFLTMSSAVPDRNVPGLAS
jgi:hypothetical protein